MYALINLTKNDVKHTSYAKDRPLTPEVFCTVQIEARQPGGKLSPGFSVTVNGKDFGGCCHDLVVAARPDLAPLVALHLSDLDGVPMHALANGEHWFSGILDDIVGAAYPYRPTAGRDTRTPAECRDIARDHFRVSDEEIDAMIAGAREAVAEARALYERRLVPLSAVKAELHAYLADEVAKLTPRWKAEAEAGTALLRTLTR
jgi:hypothetical protein